MLIIGVLYFLVRFFIDCHLLLNLFKTEIDSSGELIHNICLKVIFLLCFYQFCIFIKVLAQQEYVAAIILLTILTFTIIIYIIYNKKFLRTELFIDEDYNYDEFYLKQWYEKYRHPMEDMYNPGSMVRKSMNTEEIELKSKDERDMETNRLRLITY